MGTGMVWAVKVWRVSVGGKVGGASVVGGASAGVL